MKDLVSPVEKVWPSSGGNGGAFAGILAKQWHADL